MGILDWIGADKWFGEDLPQRTNVFGAVLKDRMGIKPPKMNVKKGYFPTAQELREQRSARAQPKTSPADEIFARLEALQNLDRYMPDMESLRAQAFGNASSQYDPIIEALRRQQTDTQARGDRDYQTLGQMFGSLSESYQKDIPRIEEQYGQTQANTAKQYEDLKGTVSDTYSKSLAEQEELANRLGIQAALPDVAAKQFSDRDYFTNRANTEAQTANTAIGMEQRGATEFTQAGSKIAKYQGTERQANLMDQLREALGALDAEIGKTEAAKGQAAASSLADLYSAASDSAGKRAQSEFDNYIDAIKLMQSMQGGQESNPVKSLADVPGRAMEGFGLSANQAQRLQDIFASTLTNDDTIMSGIDPMYGTALTDEALAARMLEAGRAGGLSRQELAALQNLSLEYFGRR